MFKKMAFSLAVTEVLLFSGSRVACAGGPDIIVSTIKDFEVQLTNASSNSASIYVTTLACNIGTAPADWYNLAFRDSTLRTKHPVIAHNLYRLLDGTFEQIGQSGVKHGFESLNSDGDCPRGMSCAQNTDEHHLGVGCSDPYDGHLMSWADEVGPRSAINPSTGEFDPSTAIRPSQSPLGWYLQTSRSDLVTNAQYFVEGQYIAADDAAAGNGLNNVSYIEGHLAAVSTKMHLGAKGNTHRGCPAITAWEGASVTAADFSGDGRILVATKIRNVASDRYRIDVAVYNMNSDRAVRLVAVPIKGLAVDRGSIGFHSPGDIGEGFSTTPWNALQEKDLLVWQTNSANEKPQANAIRWGEMFNFWFEARSASSPHLQQVNIAPFKGADLRSINVPLDGAFKCDPNAYQ